MLQSKDVGWLIGLKKNRAHLYSAYKRLTSELNTHMQKLKNENRFHANRNEKKAG